MSDSGDAFAKSPNATQLPNSPPQSHSSIDDGYLSEGGASFYAKKIQNRIALEKQKEVEEQNRKLSGLPDFLGGSSAADKMNNQIYRVVGGRKHVQKSEMGMQTESNSIKQPVQDHYDWKQVLNYVRDMA